MIENIEVLGVGIKDVILPGEMKEILNSVVQAEKAAQANIIRRREETNATRSALNCRNVLIFERWIEEGEDPYAQSRNNDPSRRFF